MTDSKLYRKFYHKTQFLQHLLIVAQKYRSSAMKIGLSHDSSDSSWGVNIWKDKNDRVQFSPASMFDGPDVTSEFLSILEIKKDLTARGVRVDNDENKVYDRKNRSKR